MCSPVHEMCHVSQIATESGQEMSYQLTYLYNKTRLITITTLNRCFSID